MTEAIKTIATETPAATETATTTATETTTTAVVDKGAAVKETPAATAAETLATGTDKDGKVTSDFPADWREKLAGDDKVLLNRLQRLTDPTQLGKTIREQDKEISKRPVPLAKPDAKATPEQIAEYRKAAGLPLEAGDYIKNLKLPDGRDLGDPDKEVAADFAKEVGLSDAGLSQAQYDKAVAWYFKRVEAEQDQRVIQDRSYRVEAEDKLRQEMGADYRANINAIGSLFDGAPAAVKDRLLGGRLADGRKIGDDPEMLTFLSRIAREQNPMASITPANGQTRGQTVDSRIAEIEKRQREDYNGYFKDNAVQEEYRTLLTAREQSKRSGRAA